jgi:hypothetical protein
VPFTFSVFLESRRKANPLARGRGKFYRELVKLTKKQGIILATIPVGSKVIIILFHLVAS